MACWRPGGRREDPIDHREVLLGRSLDGLHRPQMPRLMTNGADVERADDGHEQPVTARLEYEVVQPRVLLVVVQGDRRTGGTLRDDPSARLEPGPVPLDVERRQPSSLRFQELTYVENLVDLAA
jgi:hypothetical protein